MKSLISLCLIYCFAFQANAQNLPCSNPVYRQLDFWVGDWEAFGQNGSKAGDSKISIIADSCVILEEWTSATLQQGFRYSGKSFNTYNAAVKQWQQTWVDNTGNSTFFTEGLFKGDRIIFKTNPFAIAKDSLAIRRLTFFNLSKYKVRQLGEISRDDGKTWLIEFDLEYRRKENFAKTVTDSLFKKMENAYNSGNFGAISAHYTLKGKIVNKNEEINGLSAIKEYWNRFDKMGGTWRLINLNTEQTGSEIWVKGKSIITDKKQKQHTVNFTLILVQENYEWKILQDAYW